MTPASLRLQPSTNQKLFLFTERSHYQTEDWQQSICQGLPGVWTIALQAQIEQQLQLHCGFRGWWLQCQQLWLPASKASTKWLWARFTAQSFARLLCCSSSSNCVTFKHSFASVSSCSELRTRRSFVAGRLLCRSATNGNNATATATAYICACSSSSSSRSIYSLLQLIPAEHTNKLTAHNNFHKTQQFQHFSHFGVLTPVVVVVVFPSQLCCDYRVHYISFKLLIC